MSFDKTVKYHYYSRSYMLNFWQIVFSRYDGPWYILMKHENIFYDMDVAICDF